MKKVSLYIGIIAASLSLNSCSMMKSDSTKATATQMATSVGTQVVGDLLAGNKISGKKLLMQNLPQLGGLAMQAVNSGNVGQVLKYLNMFKGTGLEQKALQYVLPGIFNSGMANNSQVAGQVAGILTKSLGKKQASGLLTQAVKNIALSKAGDIIGGQKTSTAGYVMEMLGQKVPVTNLLKGKVSSPKQAKQQLQKEVLSTVLGKLLTK